jgi:hypothetical protein
MTDFAESRRGGLAGCAKIGFFLWKGGGCRWLLSGMLAAPVLGT